MLDLLADPAIWASFLTLTVLEIILGVDNIIFISIVANTLPEKERPRARILGLLGALVLRVGLLFSISWLMGLTEPVIALPVGDIAMSWRDIVLFVGGVFLLWKASNEIFAEVEGERPAPGGRAGATMAGVVFQIMLLDMVFSIDSVITAVGIADHLAVMVAAVVVSVLVMMAAAAPIADFINAHPSTKMLALAFLVMIGVALVADGLQFHIERGFIYAAMLFAGFVETLNLLRQRNRRKRGESVCE